MDGVSVLIPVKDEPYVKHLVQSINQELRNVAHEIIVVYGDKSTMVYDDVEDAVLVKIYGDTLERAVLTGFSLSRFDNIVVMDGDGSHPPNVIPLLLSKLNEADLVVASRFLPGGSPGHMSLYRRLASRSFIFLSKMLGVKVSDPMSGFFAFKRKILEGLRFKPVKWKVLFEILVRKANEIRVVEVPYHFQKRALGKSKTSFKIALHILYDMISISRKASYLFRTVLSLLLVAGILYFLDLNRLVEVLGSIELKYLSLAVLSYLVMTNTMALRLTYVLRRMGVRTGFREAFWAHTLGMLVSNVTPGKVGYLASVPLLSKSTGAEQKDSLTVILGIESVELLVKAFLAGISIMIFSRIASAELLFPAMVGTLAISVLGGIIIILLSRKPYWLEDVPILSEVSGYLKKFPQFRSLAPKIALISVVCWFFRGLEWYMLGLALGSNIPFSIFLVMHPLLTAVRFIPTTPSSLGIFEISVIWGLGSLGMNPEMAFTFAMLDRFDNITDLVGVKSLLRGSERKSDRI